ncbi:MAG: hypothetical protein ACREQC_17995 [Candidatus Binataceae bacterium]
MPLSAEEVGTMALQRRSGKCKQAISLLQPCGNVFRRLIDLGLRP